VLENLALEIPLFRRVSNDFKKPWLFYFGSMLSIALALLSLLYLPTRFNPLTLAFIKGSFLRGAGHAWVIFSLFVSFKHLLKAFFLMSLTGKVYNVRATLRPWAFHFQVGGESQSLIQNKGFLVLYHLSLWASPFCLVTLGANFLPSSWFAQVSLLAFLYALWQLNPFTYSQLTQFCRNLFDLEGRLQISSSFGPTSILHLLDPYSVGGPGKVQMIFRWLSLGWSLGTLGFFSWLILPHMSFQRVLQARTDAPEYVVASVLLLALLFTWHYLLFQTVKTLFFGYFAAPLRGLFSAFKRMGKVRIASPNTEEIFHQVSDLPLFNTLTDDFLRQMIQFSRVMHVPKGHFLIQEGDRAEHLYVLLTGAVEISKLSEGGRRKLSEIHPTSIFGESSISHDQYRDADAICTEAGTVLQIPAQAVRDLARDHHFLRDLDSFKGAIVVHQFFHSAPMFRSLPAEVTEMLMNRSKLDYFSPGEVVFEQGTHGDHFYMIVRGSVEVIMNQVHLKVIRQGGFFGEIAVIASIPRTATISTVEPTVLLSIQIDAFWEILVQHIELALFVESVGEQRFREGVRMFQNETPSRKVS
jgi:CRP-like cAMP-binding protein